MLGVQRQVLYSDQDARLKKRPWSRVTRQQFCLNANKVSLIFINYYNQMVFLQYF